MRPSNVKKTRISLDADVGQLALKHKMSLSNFT